MPIGHSRTPMLLAGLALALILVFCITPSNPGRAASAENPQNDVLLTALQKELARAKEDLGKLDPAPYFISYAVHDQSGIMAVSTQGEIVNSTQVHIRLGEVVMHIGTPALDNTHEENRATAVNPSLLPLDDDPAAIARVLWQLTFMEYRKAAQAYLNVKTTTQVNAKEEDTSPDFSSAAPQVHTDYAPPPALPGQPWSENLARESTAAFRKFPYVYVSTAMVTAQNDRWHFVSTEGTKLVIPSSNVRLTIEAETQADDGMELMRVETFEGETPDQMPGEAAISERVEKMAADLKALRAAPVAEPYDGPALLSGRAAAVFFHEVLGHRLEGHRQRGEQEGQTFTKKLGQAVLPEFLSVIDDPTQRTLNGGVLSGWYPYDDEGVPAQRVEVIQDGVLKSFLMSRAPIASIANSNGHGRAQPGLMPTGRQANLIVTSTRTVKDAELHQKLVDEVKKQGKPYGLYFQDIQGGFTMTQRSLPQAFQVLPVMVWRVYADGRPDELVRGVDIVGTPLAALSKILLTGDTTAVFNGVCGAESGQIPVSAAAPAMLLSELEVQKRSHSLNRPPILSPPGFESGSKPPQTEVPR